MTKKYKLIEIYPGSPPLGTEFTYWTDNISQQIYNPKYGFISMKIVNDYPKFWQEIVEKEYEILSLKYKKPDGWLHTFKCNQIVEAKIEDGFTKFKTPHNSWDYYDKSDSIFFEVFDIHSVKRLSDDEIFTIGDKYNDGDLKNETIIKFNISSENGLLVNSNMLKNISKAKQSLFKTDDGVAIYEGDIFYTIDSSFKVQTTFGGKDEVDNAWSTKEAAEKYILMNKPCLSIKEILELDIDTEQIFITDMQQLVKSKL
jgi:hypothetical protein